MQSESLWSAFNDSRVMSGTTTRIGGVSLPPFHALNLAYHTGDTYQTVKENRQRFANIVNVNESKMVFTYQSHSTILQRVNQTDAGRGIASFESGIPADALYTEEKNLLLGVFHADCVPVFLMHRYQPLIAIIHAGTPGSLKKITYQSIRQLIKETGINPHDLLAYLGPSLDFAHHPISEERVKEILMMDQSYQSILKKIGGQTYLDIPLLNYMQLIDAGLNREQISMTHLDTFSNPNLFFSYDRDKKTGRHVSFIYLR
jgi:YfiH family protein